MTMKWYLLVRSQCELSSLRKSHSAMFQEVLCVEASKSWLQHYVTVIPGNRGTFQEQNAHGNPYIVGRRASATTASMAKGQEAKDDDADGVRSMVGCLRV